MLTKQATETPLKGFGTGRKEKRTLTVTFSHLHSIIASIFCVIFLSASLFPQPLFSVSWPLWKSKQLFSSCSLSLALSLCRDSVLYFVNPVTLYHLAFKYFKIDLKGYKYCIDIKLCAGGNLDENLIEYFNLTWGTWEMIHAYTVISVSLSWGTVWINEWEKERKWFKWIGQRGLCFTWLLRCSKMTASLHCFLATLCVSVC